MKRVFSVGAVCALGFTVLSVAVAQAATQLWVAPTSTGDFADPANWSGMAVPGASDTAQFKPISGIKVEFENLPGPLANPVINQNLDLASGDVAFMSGVDGVYTYQLNGNATIGSAAQASLQLGDSSNPLHLTVANDLSLRNGSSLTATFGSHVATKQLLLGADAGAGGGQVQISGNEFGGSQLSVTGNTVVGRFDNNSSLTLSGSNVKGFLTSVDVGVYTDSAAGTHAFSVNTSADVMLSGDLRVGTGNSPATATVTLSDAGTVLTQTGSAALNIGSASQGTATVNISNGATYAMGTGTTTIHGRGGLVIGTSGIFTTNGDINVNTTGDAGTLGAITLTGGALTQAGPANFTVGYSSGGAAVVTLNSSSTLTTGTGLLTINKTGTVNLVSGTLNANGNVLIDAGQLLRSNSSGNFNLAPGKTLTVQDAGRVSLSSSYITAAGAVYNVTGGGSRFDVTGGSLAITGGAQVNVTGGGVLSSSQSSIDLGTSISNFPGTGTLVVDGSGSAVSGSSGNWAQSGGTANVTLSNGAVGTFTGTLNLATSGGSSSAPTQVNVNILSGARLTTGSIFMTQSSNSIATLTISGAGSSLVQSSGSTFSFGSSGAAVVNVNNGGILTVGSTTSFGPSGTLNINGGTVDLKSISTVAGKINFNSGSLAFSGSLTIGTTNAFLGSNLVLNATKTLTVNNGTVTVNSGAFITLQDGANFFPFNINNSGEIDFNGAMSTLTTTQGFTNSGIVRGNGRIASTFTNSNNSQTIVGAGQRLEFTKNVINNGSYQAIGLPASPAELQFDGSFTNTNNVGFITGRDTTLRFGNGSFSTQLTNNGSLALTGGTNDVFGDISNATTGAIVVTGGARTTFYDDVTQNGLLQVSKVGSTSSTAVFLGALTGSGGASGGGDIFIEGDLRPGNSPASVNFANNVGLGIGAKTQIEIAGTTPGTEYDQVHVSGQLVLGGTLQVVTLGGFSPSLGQKFDILDWGTASGTFTHLDMAALGGSLAWSTSQLYTSGVLSVVSDLPGDFNQDGFLTTDDIPAMLSALTDLNSYETAHNLGDANLLAIGDLDQSGTVTNADVQALLNLVASGGGSVQSVPEPATCCLTLIAGFVSIALARRRAK